MLQPDRGKADNQTQAESVAKDESRTNSEGAAYADGRQQVKMDGIEFESAKDQA